MLNNPEQIQRLRKATMLRICANVQVRMMAFDMNDEDVAEATGLHKNTVMNIRMGVDGMRIETLVALSTAFGCEPNDLLK